MPKGEVLLTRAIALILGFQAGLIDLDSTDLQLIETALKHKVEKDEDTAEVSDGGEV